MRAGALAEAGRLAEASAELDRFDEELSRGGTAGVIAGAPLAIRHLSEVCRRLGRRAEAAAMLTLVEPWGGQVLVSPWALSIEGAADRAIGHLLATLGRIEEADAAYIAAARIEREAGFPPLLARTAYWHAQALLDRDAEGDSQRSRALLDNAVELAAHLGMLRLRHDAASLRDHMITTRPS